MTTKKAPKKKTPTKKKVAPKGRRRIVKVTSSVAVLAALADGATTIKEIAKIARMQSGPVTQTLARLRGKEPPQVKRTNKKGFAVIATYKITQPGRKALRAAIKEMG